MAVVLSREVADAINNFGCPKKVLMRCRVFFIPLILCIGAYSALLTLVGFLKHEITIRFNHQEY